MKMKKFLVTLLAGIMVLSLTACGGSSTEPATKTEGTSEPAATIEPIAEKETFKIIWAHNSAENTVTHRAAAKFKELIEAKSEGQIEVEIYSNGALGNVVEASEAIKDGTIQMQNGSPGSLLSAPLGIFELPNVVTSREDALKVFGEGTEVRKAVDKEFENNGLKLIGLVPQAFRVMSSNVPVKSYEDLKGVNIRVMENPVSISYWKSWGANPTPIAFSELYIALQQKLVDAQENPLDVLIAAKLYEQQKYVIETNHMMFYNGIWMNLDFYNNLPTELQEMIKSVMKDVDEYVYNDAIKSEQASREELKNLGIEFITLPESDLIKMREAATETVKIVRESAGNEIVDALLNSLK